jgi:hypothetical protein
VIGQDNIRPLRYYSADAFVVFGESTNLSWHKVQMENFEKWWDSNSVQLKGLGFEKNNPKNAIGWIPVAHLNMNKGDIVGLDTVEIVNLVGRHQFIKDVQVVRADESLNLKERMNRWWRLSSESK